MIGPEKESLPKFLKPIRSPGWSKVNILGV